jgi:hypothetical protein
MHLDVVMMHLLHKGFMENYQCWCSYLIFDPCFDNFSEKTKNSKKNNENPKNAFLIYLHRF